MIATLKQQFIDLKVEVIDRVDWPKPEKVRSATYAVLVVSAFVGSYLFLVDMGINYFMKLTRLHP